MKKSLLLEGKSVFIPRGGKQGTLLSNKIINLGGTPFIVPLIDFTEVNGPLDSRLVRNFQRYEWVIFTSQNGVNFFFKQLDRMNKVLSPKTQIAAVGEKTKKAIEKRGLKVAFMPKHFSSDDFTKEFIHSGFRPKYVLIPKGNLARDTIARSLRMKNCEVDEWIVYETIFPSESKSLLAQILKDEHLDFAMFTSPSTVRHFMEVVHGPPLLDKVKEIRLISIGPVTKKEIEGFGLSVAASPEKYTVDDMVECICRLNIVMEEI